MLRRGGRGDGFPWDIDIRNKERRELQRPDGTKIVDTFPEFYAIDIYAYYSDNEVLDSCGALGCRYWSGVNIYLRAIPPCLPLPAVGCADHENADAWASASGDAWVGDLSSRSPIDRVTSIQIPNASLNPARLLCASH